MFRYILKGCSWIGMAILCVAVVAQTSDCPTLVEDALSSIDVLCNEAGRNQACYGNVSIETEFQADAAETTFESVGDIVDLSAIQTMQLSPMDEANGHWGLAVLKLQANIPDTLPGQNVTFLLFGDVEISDASSDFPDADLTPMHAFYLKTGIGDANCNEAPESGILVQTPDGVTDVAFNINGVDVAMGSTILFQAQASENMHIHALEGSAMMELEGDIHTAVAGTRLRVPIDENFTPTGPPPLPESYDDGLINRIPHGRLERQIQPPPPLPPDQLAQAHEMIGNGQLPCGMDGFPACEKLPTGGLRNGPMCQHDGDGCSERLAPHEGKGILPPPRQEQCGGEQCPAPQTDGQLPCDASQRDCGEETRPATGGEAVEEREPLGERESSADRPSGEDSRNSGGGANPPRPSGGG